MTKVKIMLSAVAGLATIGGAFALKAKKLGTLPLYTIRSFSTAAPTGFQYCTILLTATGTVYDVPTAGSSYYYVTETAPSASNLKNPCQYAYYTEAE